LDRILGSSCCKLVAEPLNRHDPGRLLRSVFQLLPQTGDVHIHGARERSAVVAPYFAQELLSRQSLARVLQEVSQQLKLARRSGRGLLVFMMDVDGLKQINDSFGHLEGDRALKHTSDVLEETFRDSDVVARLGGDEFAVLAIEAAGHSELTIKTRLLESLKSINAKQSGYEISLSLGLARFDPSSRTSIGELMVKADQVMYEQKRRRSRLLFEVQTSTQSP